MAVSGVMLYAPMLATYGPYLLAIAVGYALACFVGARRKRSRSAFIPRDQVTSPEAPRLGQISVLPQTPELTDPGEDTDYDVYPHVPYRGTAYSEGEMVARSREFYKNMDGRRSVRMFSDRTFPVEVLHNALRTAGTSPSGAHTQPWTYVVVSDPEVKGHIRVIIEEEERINYERRMGEKWLSDLKPMKTDWQKPYLTLAPYLVVVFKQISGLTPDGEKKTHYYSEISISISVGLLLAALQNAGLSTVTSTPMNAGPALRSLLQRPTNEKAILLLPVGFPADTATVPKLQRKPLESMMVAI